MTETLRDPAARAQRTPIAKCRDGSAVFYSGHTTGDHGTEEWEVVTLVRVTPDRRVDFRRFRAAGPWVTCRPNRVHELNAEIPGDDRAVREIKGMI